MKKMMDLNKRVSLFAFAWLLALPLFAQEPLPKSAETFDVAVTVTV